MIAIASIPYLLVRNPTIKACVCMCYWVDKRRGVLRLDNITLLLLLIRARLLSPRCVCMYNTHTHPNSQRPKKRQGRKINVSWKRILQPSAEQGLPTLAIKRHAHIPKYIGKTYIHSCTHTHTPTCSKQSHPRSLTCTYVIVIARTKTQKAKIHKTKRQEQQKKCRRM